MQTSSPILRKSKSRSCIYFPMFRIASFGCPSFCNSNGPGSSPAACRSQDGFSGPQLVPRLVGFADTGQAVNSQSGSAAVAHSHTQRTKGLACSLQPSLEEISQLRIQRSLTQSDLAQKQLQPADSELRFRFSRKLCI